MTRPSRGSSDRTSASNDTRAHRPPTGRARTSTAATTSVRRRYSGSDDRRYEGDHDDSRDGSIAPGSRVTLASPRMNVLLLRPVPGNERFGLGPFFRIEPLGMEYIAARARSRAAIASRSPISASAGRSSTRCAWRGPALVGIAAMHALETDDVLALAAEVRALSPDVPDRHRRPHRRGVSGSVSVARRRRRRARRWRAGAAATVRCARTRRPLTTVPGLALPDGEGGDIRTRRRDRHARARRRAAAGATSRRRLAPPVRVPGASAVVARRDGARLSVPLLVLFDLAAARPRRARAVDRLGLPRLRLGRRSRLRRRRSVLAPPVAQPRAGPRARRRGIRKQWILVQSRVDLVARHPELLEAWRPLARRVRHLLRPRGGDQRGARAAS